MLLGELLSGYRTDDPTEAADVARLEELLETVGNPFRRAIPLHVTGSALIVHPDSGRVLLRWHERQRAWLHVGGHGDPGETDPIAIALREAREETGLTDLVPWPTADIVHVAIGPVPAKGDEPAHEHADVRYVLATASPDAARPEKPGAPVRWLSVPEAYEVTAADNLRVTIARLESLLGLEGVGLRQPPRPVD